MTNPSLRSMEVGGWRFKAKNFSASHQLPQASNLKPKTFYARFSIFTIPVLPSTFTVSPVLRTEVAIPVPVTDGTPYSLHTIAAWQVRPPMSVTEALILVKIGAQAGFVVGQTSISPCSILVSSSRCLTTLTFPSPTPADEAHPFSSVTSVGTTAIPFSHS